MRLFAGLALMLATPALAQTAPPVPPHAPAANDPATWRTRLVLGFDATGAEQTRLAEGAADASGRRVDSDTLVRVASISKLTVAIAVMRLVEQRRLDLDADVSRYLGWTLRHPAHPTRPITLRQLLSHRAGLSDGAGYLLPLDGDLEAHLRQPAAWEASRAPGGDFRYANVNFPVVAAAMEGATGERFDQLMQRLVFRPFNIEACFNWSRCTPAAATRAQTLYRPSGEVARDDLRGALPACPVTPASDGSCDLSRYRLARNGSSFSPQGGLRISARGLARIGQMLLRDGDRLLRPESARALLRSPRDVRSLGTTVGEGGEGAFFCRYGLALHALATRRAGCRDDPFGDGVTRLGHSGEAYSLRAGMYIDPRRRDGVVWIVTGLPEIGATSGARSDFSAAEEAALTAAGYPNPPSRASARAR